MSASATKKRLVASIYMFDTRISVHAHNLKFRSRFLTCKCPQSKSPTTVSPLEVLYFACKECSNACVFLNFSTLSDWRIIANNSPRISLMTACSSSTTLRQPELPCQGANELAYRHVHCHCLHVDTPKPSHTQRRWSIRCPLKEKKGGVQWA